MGGMSLSIYKKGDYEEFYAFGRRKNKANSKPNKLVLSSVEWSQLPGFGRYVFSQGKAIPIPINDNWDEAATQ